MGLYLVKDGRTLQHGVLVVHGPAIIELPAHVGGDVALSDLIETFDPPALVVADVPRLSYRVKDGHELAHDGAVRSAGTIVHIPPHVAADSTVAQHIDPVDLEPPSAAVEAPSEDQE